jgi:hypothetical protein
MVSGHEIQVVVQSQKKFVGVNKKSCPALQMAIEYKEIEMIA